MAIEDWESEPAPEDAVDDPRRHTLGGFRAGEGFLSIDDDETLTALEFEKDEALVSDSTDPRALDALVAELWKP